MQRKIDSGNIFHPRPNSITQPTKAQSETVSMSASLDSSSTMAEQVASQLFLAGDYSALLSLSMTCKEIQQVCQLYLAVIKEEHTYVRSQENCDQVRDHIGDTLGGSITGHLCQLGAHYWYWTRGPGREKSGDIFGIKRKNAYLNYKQALFDFEKPMFEEVDEPCPPEERLYSWYMLETQTPIEGISPTEAKRIRFISPEGVDSDECWRQSQLD